MPGLFLLLLALLATVIVAIALLVAVLLRKPDAVDRLRGQLEESLRSGQHSSELREQLEDLSRQH